MRPNQDTIIHLLTALGDPIRLRLLFLLGDTGRLPVNEIAAHFSITRSAVSHHLKVLRDAHAVSSEKIGQEVYYWVAREYLATALSQLAEAIRTCQGE